MDDIQILIDKMFPFVENLLKKYDEFFPFAVALDKNNLIQDIEPEYDTEKPDSDVVIAELKRKINKSKKDFIAFTIFYEVFLPDDKTRAVAVKVEHAKENFPFILYYPFRFIGKEISFETAWKTRTEYEVF